MTAEYISHLSVEEVTINSSIVLISATVFYIMSWYSKMYARQSKIFSHQRDPTTTEHLIVDFSTRIPSTVHAFVAFSFSAYYFYVLSMHPNDPLVFPLVQNMVTGSSPTWKCLTSFSAGYFLWDLCACLSNFQVFGAAFTFHAAACFLIYLLPLVLDLENSNQYIYFSRNPLFLDLLLFLLCLKAALPFQICIGSCVMLVSPTS